MRVIGGLYRSRILDEVESDKTRETKDRVKEAIFNSINPALIEASVLDLFAGSGSLGIEALSRGSKGCVFVDKSPLAVDVVRSNIDKLGIASISEIYYGDYTAFLEKTYQNFDVILLDPPYHMDKIDDIVTLIARKKLLNDNGVIVALYGKNSSLKTENNGIIEYKKKTMGITNISFLRWGI